MSFADHRTDPVTTAIALEDAGEVAALRRAALYVCGNALHFASDSYALGPNDDPDDSALMAKMMAVADRTLLEHERARAVAERLEGKDHATVSLRGYVALTLDANETQPLPFLRVSEATALEAVARKMDDAGWPKPPAGAEIDERESWVLDVVF